MVFSVLDFDPDINLKKLLKLAIQNKHLNDTVYYKNSNVHYMFSDYINVKITNSNNKTFFLPRHISINRVNSPVSQKAFKIMIDYKLVKFNK